MSSVLHQLRNPHGTDLLQPDGGGIAVRRDTGEMREGQQLLRLRRLHGNGGAGGVAGLAGGCWNGQHCSSEQGSARNRSNQILQHRSPPSLAKSSGPFSVQPSVFSWGKFSFRRIIHSCTRGEDFRSPQNI